MEERQPVTVVMRNVTDLCGCVWEYADQRWRWQSSVRLMAERSLVSGHEFRLSRLGLRGRAAGASVNQNCAGVPSWSEGSAVARVMCCSSGRLDRLSRTDQLRPGRHWPAPIHHRHPPTPVAGLSFSLHTRVCSLSTSRSKSAQRPRARKALTSTLVSKKTRTLIQSCRQFRTQP